MASGATLSAYSCGRSRGMGDELPAPHSLFTLRVGRTIRGMTYALPSPRVQFVLGGARSGKSALAEGLVTALPPPWTYVATGQAWDAEMRTRIALHRDRRLPGWVTVEEPLDLCRALRDAKGPVLVDCLTLWVTNLLLADRLAEMDGLIGALDRDANTVLVSNEVGLGIVPDNALSRAFRDAAGRLHQAVAARADTVLFAVAGLPMRIKG